MLSPHLSNVTNEIQLIDVAVAVNKALEPNYMPSVVKVGSGQMENS